MLLNYYYKKKIKFVKTHRKRTRLLENCPQKKGICRKVTITAPKKPNSAKRKIARVFLISTKKALTAYIPGETHNLLKFSTVLIRGGRLKDVPGINCRVIRGKFDCQCILERRQGRSKVGTPKKLLDQVLQRQANEQKNQKEKS